MSTSPRATALTSTVSGLIPDGQEGVDLRVTEHALSSDGVQNIQDIIQDVGHQGLLRKQLILQEALFLVCV